MQYVSADGRLVRCELIVTVDSFSINTPNIGLVSDEVWHNGHPIIPAGPEVHGSAPVDRVLERFACAIIRDGAYHHQETPKRFRGAASGNEIVPRALDRVIRKGRFSNLAELRQTFPHADQVGKFTVFNIGGNKARLIAALHYNRNKLFIRHVLTHNEYDAGKWKE